ncbi:MAG: glycosyl hydrolase family 18 protein [Anaerolineae bacterium]
MKHKISSVFALVLVAAIAVVVIWGWVPPEAASANCVLDRNAAWLSVDWTSTPADEAAIARLAEDASRRKLEYLFPYASYVKPGGTFSNSYTYAPRFVSIFRRFNRDTRLLAWVGIAVKNESGLGVNGPVDLQDEETRQRIVAFIADLVRQGQFDGVHLDVEPIWNNDAGYLRLIQEVRIALGPGHIVSVAGGQWIPDWLVWVPTLGQLRWSSAYYRAVAQNVDQIVSMTYDSYMTLPELYRFWLREEVRGIRTSVSGSNVELLFGVSVSREDTASHHPSAENLQSGLAGICAGLSPANVPSHANGVAIYASWEAETQDWQVWDNWQKGLR